MGRGSTQTLQSEVSVLQNISISDFWCFYRIPLFNIMGNTGKSAFIDS